ncbi:unnamed protein product [Phytophthora fragariaefolia]|uniref:Unnamed protein product n=1 Tax=Phytophthora fragariaefolia TaxID=1490495 RepID=A0A9W7D3B7_9STRA|nr:unnamed protein product [Phytophthora fragariaefolia]
MLEERASLSSVGLSTSTLPSRLDVSSTRCRSTYEVFKEELRQAFEPPQNEFRSRAEFIDLQQGKHDVHAYAQRARYLVSNIVTNPIDKATKVVTFMKGLRDGPVKTYLFRDCAAASAATSAHRRATLVSGPRLLTEAPTTGWPSLLIAVLFFSFAATVVSVFDSVVGAVLVAITVVLAVVTDSVLFVVAAAESNRVATSSALFVAVVSTPLSSTPAPVSHSHVLGRQLQPPASRPMSSILCLLVALADTACQPPSIPQQEPVSWQPHSSH